MYVYIYINMDLDFYFYFYLLLSIIFEVSAQYFFKSIHLNRITNFKKVGIMLGVIFYSFTGYFAYKLLNYAEIGVINIIWHLFHFITLFVVGYLLLNETLSNRKIIATMIGVISLILFIWDSDGHMH